jgi:hypothetical protein
MISSRNRIHSEHKYTLIKPLQREKDKLRHVCMRARTPVNVEKGRESRAPYTLYG